MNKNFFSVLADKPAIDKGFTTLWSGKSGNSIISDYIRKNYFVMAFAFAAKILAKKVPYDRLEEEVSKMVVDTMGQIIEAADKGTLGYKGTAAFSTYIFQALKLRRSGKNKIYYPSDVKREGLPAMEVYRHLIIERYSRSETLSLIKYSYQISEDKIEKYIELAASYHMKESNRNTDKREQYIQSYDQILEETPHFEKCSMTTPQNEFFKKQDIEQINKAVSALNEKEKSVVNGYFLDGRWSSIKEMESELDLKNGVYELKKVKDKLKNMLQEDFIREQIFEGLLTYCNP